MTTTTSTSSCPSAPRPRHHPAPAPARRGPTSSTMPVDHLSIRGFRSYRELEVDFPGGPQVVVGDNAAGKTNLLEAMVVLSQGSSHRTTTDQELITWGEPMARLDATRVDGQHRGRAPRGSGSMPGARKRVKVNGVPRRTSALSGALRAVVFAPEDMQLVVGSPSLRRHSLDTLVAQHVGPAAAAMSTYARALTQRNNLLRRIREEAAGRDELPYWDDVVVAEGGRILRWRARDARRARRAPRAMPTRRSHRAREPLTLRSVTNAAPLAGRDARGRAAAPPGRDRRQGDLERRHARRSASRRPRIRPRRPRAVGVRVARPAAHRDPGLQARPARPAHRGRRPAAAAAPGRCLLASSTRSDEATSCGASVACRRPS